MNKKKFDTGLIGRIAEKGKKLNLEETTTNINPSTNIDTDISTKSTTNIDIAITKKKKYPNKLGKEKLQRAYYFEKELLKEFDNFCKRNKADKSEVISFALREFLDTYE